MSGETPLSYGQLYSWREIETYPAGWRMEANIPATWDLRGIPAARVDEALRLLIERHEPLRTTYHVRDGVPSQRVHTRLPQPIERVDKVITSYSEPDRMTAELVATPIAMTGGPCWRGVLVSMHGEPMFLSLSFSHLILDIWSTLELERQFHVLAADPAAELPATVSPVELARAQRGDAQAGRRRAAERYWGTFIGSRLPGGWPTLPYDGTANRIQVTLHSRALTEATNAAAGAHATTAATVLMSLVAAGLSRHLGTGQVLLNLMFNNRLAAELKQTVGTLNQLIPVLVDVDQHASLAAHTKHAHWAAVKAYRHSSYDTDRVFQLAREGAGDVTTAHDCWFNHLFPCWFNYLDLGGAAEQNAAPEPAVLEWAPRARQYGQPFDTRVTVRNGHTQLQLRADPALLDADALTDVLRTVVHGTLMALTNPEASLADLTACLAGDLPAAVFPGDVAEPPWLAA